MSRALDMSAGLYAERGVSALETAARPVAERELREALTIRPGTSRQFTPPAAPAKGVDKGLLASLALHLFALVCALVWTRVLTAPPQPEPVAVEIVVEAPPAAEPPPPAAQAPSPPAVETPPPEPVVPPVADAPAQVAAEPPPPPVAQTPPPEPEPSPPEAAPPPVAEAPAPVEPPAPPVAEAPSPALPEPTPVSPPPGLTLKPIEPVKPALQVRPKPKPPTPAPLHPRAETPPAAKPAAPAPAALSAQAAGYQDAVYARITARKHYPEAAMERAPRGVAIVRFSIDPAGQVLGAALAKSAGDSILDADALATVQRAGPFPPPPQGAPHNFSASLNYRPR